MNNATTNNNATMHFDEFVEDADQRGEPWLLSVNVIGGTLWHAGSLHAFHVIIKALPVGTGFCVTLSTYVKGSPVPYGHKVTQGYVGCIVQPDSSLKELSATLACVGLIDAYHQKYNNQQ